VDPRRRTRLGAAALITAMALVLPAGSATLAKGKPGSELARYATPGSYVWVVPRGVSQVTFDVYGAQGGTAESSITAPGGRGGQATVTIAVKPGQAFQLVVGGAGGTDGTGGTNGGGGGTTVPGSGVESGAGAGGGGASDVRTWTCVAAGNCGPSTRLVVAGGGGGGVVTLFSDRGGYGGGILGGPGSPTELGFAGRGGTQSAGGAGGSYLDVIGRPGDFGSGGNARAFYAGGGGGSGWWGGGGGVLGSGGGGSGYITPSALSGILNEDVREGNGLIVVSKTK
jgi:hypothetical protein